MIVDPDFLDHWRTGMVVDALGDPTAPMCILRLWAHCQERRSDTFGMPTRGLKAQCRFQGDAEAFERALIEAGFIERNGEFVTVTGWAEKNASLLAAWENGAKGGRPKKQSTQAEPTGSIRVSGEEPTGNPTETQAKPIREEKTREEEKSSTSSSSASLPTCPHREVIALFGKHLPYLPQPKPELWDGQRAKDLTARWRWLLTKTKQGGERYATNQAEGLAWFDRFFAYVAQSDFLTGRSGKWTCDLGWLMKAENFAKVVQGNYENKEAA